MPTEYGFSWKWAAPAIGLVGVTLLIGIVTYPGLPDRIPIHFGADGKADSYADKNIWSSFGIVLVQVATLLVVFAASSTRLRRYANGPDFRTFGRSMLLFGAAAQLTLLLAALVVWQLLPAGGWLLPVILAPTAGGVVYLLMQSRRHRIED